MKRFLIILGILAVIGVGLYFAFGRPKPTTLEYAVAKRGPIAEYVSGSGKVKPIEYVALSSEVPGKIDSIFVTTGQQVRKGQVLVQIDLESYASQVERARANLYGQRASLLQADVQLNKARLNLETIRKNFERNKALYDKGVINASEFETIEGQFKQAQEEVNVLKQTREASSFSVKAAQASYEEADANIKKTTLRAPFSGTVLSVAVEAGERVVGTSQMQGTEVLKIGNPSGFEVVVQINESDIVKISHGQKVRVFVDAYPNDTVYGEIGNINEYPEVSKTSDEIVEYKVRVDLTKSAKAREILRPGMSATVEILTQTKDGALLIPSTAIRIGQTKPGTAAKQRVKPQTILTAKAGKLTEKDVRTGLTDFANVEVLQNVQVGDTIIVGPPEQLKKKPIEIKQFKLVKEGEVVEDGPKFGK